MINNELFEIIFPDKDFSVFIRAKKDANPEDLKSLKSFVNKFPDLSIIDDDKLIIKKALNLHDFSKLKPNSKEKQRMIYGMQYLIYYNEFRYKWEYMKYPSPNHKILSSYENACLFFIKNKKDDFIHPEDRKKRILLGESIVSKYSTYHNIDSSILYGKDAMYNIEFCADTKSKDTEFFIILDIDTKANMVIEYAKKFGKYFITNINKESLRFHIILVDNETCNYHFIKYDMYGVIQIMKEMMI